MAKRERSAPAQRPTPADEIPRRVSVPTLNDHLEIMTRAIFQAGLSWAMIGARWGAFISAFERFDVPLVAAYGEFEIERLMQTDQIIHSRKKIAGTIANAQTLIALDRAFGSIAQYVRQFDAYALLLADARERFAFLGDLSCYYWLFRTGNPVPPFEHWIAHQPSDHPRMREMVMTARAERTSPERDDFSLSL